MSFFVIGGISGETYDNAACGCAFELPSGWSVDSSIMDILIIKDELSDSADITVAKYYLERDSQINSEEALVEAIAGLYQEIGIKSANRGTIGYSIDGATAVFVAEFKSHDVQTDIIRHNKLKGVLARLASDKQALYLITASAAPDIFEKIRPRIDTLMNSFTITAPLADELYSRRSFMPYLMILLVIALTALFYSRNRRVQKSRNPLGKDSGSFWRCASCGLVNHIDSNNCNRCGREKIAADKIKKSWLSLL